MTDMFGHEVVDVPLVKVRQRVASVPIVKMRSKFGKGPEGATCGQCEHLFVAGRPGKKFFKCDVYGASRSEASDFRKKWAACGKFAAIQRAQGRG